MVIKQSEWVLEKRISIGTAVLMTAQTIALIIAGSWWIADVDSRVKRNADSVADIKVEQSTLRQQQSISSLDAARFDERLRAFDKQLVRFDHLIDRISAAQNNTP